MTIHLTMAFPVCQAPRRERMAHYLVVPSIMIRLQAYSSSYYCISFSTTIRMFGSACSSYCHCIHFTTPFRTFGSAHFSFYHCIPFSTPIRTFRSAYSSSCHCFPFSTPILTFGSAYFACRMSVRCTHMCWCFIDKFVGEYIIGTHRWYCF